MEPGQLSRIIYGNCLCAVDQSKRTLASVTLAKEGAACLLQPYSRSSCPYTDSYTCISICSPFHIRDHPRRRCCTQGTDSKTAIFCSLSFHSPGFLHELLVKAFPVFPKATTLFSSPRDGWCYQKVGHIWLCPTFQWAWSSSHRWQDANNNMGRPPASQTAKWGTWSSLEDAHVDQREAREKTICGSIFWPVTETVWTVRGAKWRPAKPGWPATESAFRRYLLILLLNTFQLALP